VLFLLAASLLFLSLVYLRFWALGPEGPEAWPIAVQVQDVPDDARAFMFGEQVDANHISIEGLDLIAGFGEKSASRLINFMKERGGIIDISELQGPDVPLNHSQKAVASVYLR